MEGYESVYDYLVDTYGENNVKECKSGGEFNGVYSVKIGREVLYANSNVSLDDVKIVASFPGCGNGDDANVRGLMTSSTPPNYWMIESHSAGAYSTISSIASNDNVNVSSIDLSYFSASGNSTTSWGGLNKAAAFIDDNPELANKVTITAVEGSYLSSSVSDKAIATLAENKTPVIVIGGSGGTGRTQTPKHAASLSSRGVNATFVCSAETSHGGVVKSVFRNGFHEYFLGINDEINNTEKCNYVARVYNNETGEFEEVDLNSIGNARLRKARGGSFSSHLSGATPDIRDRGSETDLLDSNYDTSQFTSVDDEFEITVETSDKYSHLRDIGSLSLKGDYAIKSDYQYVLNSMNQIRKSLCSSSVASGHKFQRFRSNTGIPGGLNKYIDAYYDVIGQLMDKLKEETESVVSIAQSMIDMDNDLNTRSADELHVGRHLKGVGGLIGARLGSIIDHIRRHSLTGLFYDENGNIVPYDKGEGEQNRRDLPNDGHNPLGQNIISNANKKGTQNVDVKETINENYNKLTYFDSKDGNNLYIQKSNSYTISVPNDYHGGEVNVIIYSDAAKDNSIKTRGQSKYYSTDTTGKLNAQEDFLDAITANNPDTIVVSTYFGVSNKDVGEMLDVLESLEVDPNKVVVSGWSAGGNEALTITNEIITNHQSLGTPEVLLIDSNHTNQLNGQVMQNLKENDVKCTLITSLGEKTIEDKLSKLIDNNVDLDVINVDFTSNGSYHMERRNIAVYDDVFGYLLGTRDEPSSDYANVNYTFQSYDYDTNSIVEK